MFGRLPALHQALIVSLGLAIGALSGLWIAHFTSVQLAATAGGFLGGAAGLLLAFALIHDFRHQDHNDTEHAATVRRRSRSVRARRR